MYYYKILFQHIIMVFLDWDQASEWGCFTQRQGRQARTKMWRRILKKKTSKHFTHQIKPWRKIDKIYFQWIRSWQDVAPSADATPSPRIAANATTAPGKYCKYSSPGKYKRKCSFPGKFTNIPRIDINK